VSTLRLSFATVDVKKIVEGVGRLGEALWVKLFKYFHPDRTDVWRDANIRYSLPASLNDSFFTKGK
jgi:hypothetical protein